MYSILSKQNKPNEKRQTKMHQYIEIETQLNRQIDKQILTKINIIIEETVTVFVYYI